MRRALLLAGAIAFVVACGGPRGAGYLLRAGWSEARLLLRRQPITALLAEPDLDPALRERLELVLAAREFARDLGLRVGDSYTTYADVDRDETVYVLSAAYRDRLEPYTWWFPIVGRVPYRGFFDRGAAEEAARRLAPSDLDVDVRPAITFSTLGWFADPLLSTVADDPPVPLVETVIHELFHSTVYVPGEAAFNESAATFAGHRGAIAFFCDGPHADAAHCTEARHRWRATRARAAVLGRLASRLRRLYASDPPVARRERARLWLASSAAETLARRGLGGRRDLVPPNNARLLGELIYATDLDRFDDLAATDADLRPALTTLVEDARSRRGAFAALRG
jgi:predicted aminopeptidase